MGLAVLNRKNWPIYNASVCSRLYIAERLLDNAIITKDTINILYPGTITGTLGLSVVQHLLKICKSPNRLIIVLRNSYAFRSLLRYELERDSDVFSSVALLMSAFTFLVASGSRYLFSL